MRIYNRKEFLKLPNGTIFCKGTKWCFDNISVKDDSWENDFLYVYLCDIEANNSDQLIDRLEDSLSNGTSYPITNHTLRDGMFDEDAIFLVFEEKDLEFLINIMKASIVKVNGCKNNE